MGLLPSTRKVMVGLIKQLRFLFLFIVLVLFALAKGIETEYEWWKVTEYIFIALMILSLLVIGHKKKQLLFWLIIPIGLEFLFLFFGNPFPEAYTNLIKYSIAIAFSIIMAVACLSYTLTDKSINITTLFGSLSAYFFIGLFYAYLYLLIVTIHPESFTGLSTPGEGHAIYYSFVTLTTLGFGDIIPIGSLAKTFSWMEAFTGQAYIAIILAQLVGRYVGEHMDEHR